MDNLDLAAAALRGFLVGAGLIVAIGAQNAFVLERGLARNHVFAVCLVCAVSDALLIAAGVGGLGALVTAAPRLITAVTIGGAGFLLVYAGMALKRAWSPAALDERRGGRDMGLKLALATALALTFLNPHVYLDTVLLIGSLSAGYALQAERIAYAGGAMTASFVWFFALGYGARLLAPLFARPVAWRILDGLIAIMMFTIAISLLVGLQSA